MKTIRNALFASGLLAAFVPAQCANLAVTGTGAPGTSLQFAVNGTAASIPAFLMLSLTQGSTSLPLGPFGSLTLGLAQPVLPLPIGMTDASGDASLTIAVPSAATYGLDLFGQGVTVGFSFTPPTGGGLPTFSLVTCATNVVSFHLGV